ncbi:NAD(P)/FAD-dependent oxidoreductase [Kutzneria buriramensis]|uniref:Cation diffusion facilitator CzcD-associated flavoprotein CzcO n=1 Tax=Kutzneria buriramensis TaxID=1045776 RepID=A0A3E0I8J2_9PSEU|nr:NAD(P)/FAD-dependent oxidoreductase [Kutzneria buriramensis]REH54455.1 cation diffusion facilitator CzcD-associated flavoprotein CzcO [Kutzneria buriramensis]
MTATHVDVLIVGAGLSGVNAAYRLRTRTPRRTYTILEARDAIGGTWDQFRYPGVRSDSDMFTLGYPFRPWPSPQAIADGPSILDYVRETAALSGIDRQIRFRHKVLTASWSTKDARWTVEAVHDGEPVAFTCAFLYLCSGYYSYDSGHVVDFPGRDHFAGDIVHPQFWPEDLDYAGKNVVVIGSGATAVTLVPALADKAAHVTMLQRSPSYVIARPGQDALANKIRSVLPERLAHQVNRSKNLVLSTIFYQYMRRFPDRAAAFLRRGAAAGLGDTVPVDPHFTPAYKPWDQRLCLVPDGDLFKALRADQASVVTDHIETFTAGGIKVKSGRELPADIIVTATGLKVVAMGGIALTVDGKAVDTSTLTVYKGMMFSGIPNLAWCVGYANNSWTLRADLTSQYVCRLLNHMDRGGFTVCTPTPTERDATSGRPILNLTSGYVKRAEAILPKQGRRRPWRTRQSYLVDLVDLRLTPVTDGVMRFTTGPRAAPRPAAGAGRA